MEANEITKENIKEESSWDKIKKFVLSWWKWGGVFSIIILILIGCFVLLPLLILAIPLLLGFLIYWLVTRDSKKDKESEYFTCKECGKEFYKTYQVEKDICKDCYEKKE